MKKAAALLIIAAWITTIAAGCGEPNVYQPPPPPSVTVAHPVKKAVTIYLEETATTEPVERVEIRARVRGFLDRVEFEPGQLVKQGDDLYQIEPEQFQATVDAAAAELEAQGANRKRAEIEKTRQENLQRESPGATSEVAVVAAQADFQSAEASVKAARAALKQAELDLSYTEVTAPVNGRVGKTLVKQGNLVGDNEATHLTTVISYDPIYANFNISERDLLELRERSPRENKADVDKEDIKIFLARANDSDFPFEGHFDYADLEVDQSMGTYMIRGIFPNPDFKILPGLFVRVRVPVGEEPDALLVPERAVGADQLGRYLLVVNSDNVVERRNVVIGTKVGDMVVVSEGLLADELVIIDGIQRARPGLEVEPQRTELAAGSEQVEAIRGGGAPPLEPAEAESGSESDFEAESTDSQ